MRQTTQLRRRLQQSKGADPSIASACSPGINGSATKSGARHAAPPIHHNSGWGGERIKCEHTHSVIYAR